MRWNTGFLALLAGTVLIACADDPVELSRLQADDALVAQHAAAANGSDVANGWYEAEEIYYLLLGVEEGVTERGENDIYLIGGDRRYQANVVEFIPGEPGYSPHWNVYLVNTAEGVTLSDILASPYASAHYPEALFDDVEDLRGARQAGLVTFERPGVVVLCPIISEAVEEAPGTHVLPEAFESFPETF
jgi:hypothetical protein